MTTDILTCKQCGSRYTCEHKQYPFKDSGSFTCEVCGEIFLRWSGTDDFFGLKLIEAKPWPISAPKKA